jgi:type II secretory pathway component PulF
MTPLGPAALVLLVIPGIALRIALRALYGNQRLAAADPMQMLLSQASLILFILAGLGVGAGMFGFWALLLLLPIVVPMLVTRIRQSQHRALVFALAAAAQRGIPLSEAARAFADETLGDSGLRSLALAEAIERGEPLSNAAKLSRLWMSSAVKLAVRLGERLGVLGPAMRQQLNDSQQIDSAVRDVIGRFCYLAAIVLVMTAVSSFVMLKIVPVFQRIFQEFGLKLPALTQLIVDSANYTASIGIFVALAISALTLPVAIYLIAFVKHLADRVWPIDPNQGRLMYWLQQSVRVFLAILLFLMLLVFWPPIFIVGSLALILAGWFPRDIPLVWRFFKRYDGALMMRGLALAIRRGMPLPEAMHLVADCYPITIAGGRLRWAADRAASGMNWRDSLRQTGLIGQADSAVLGAAERVGNLDWALEEMADSAIRRQIYRAQAALQFLFPSVMLVLGFVVCMFVVGLFLPIVSLIQGLT